MKPNCIYEVLRIISCLDFSSMLSFFLLQSGPEIDSRNSGLSSIHSIYFSPFFSHDRRRFCWRWDVVVVVVVVVVFAVVIVVVVVVFNIPFERKRPFIIAYSTNIVHNFKSFFKKICQLKFIGFAFSEIFASCSSKWKLDDCCWGIMIYHIMFFIRCRSKDVAFESNRNI